MLTTVLNLKIKVNLRLCIDQNNFYRTRFQSSPNNDISTVCIPNPFSILVPVPANEDLSNHVTILPCMRGRSHHGTVDSLVWLPTDR